jgi:hypothetical protein
MSDFERDLQRVQSDSAFREKFRLLFAVMEEVVASINGGDSHTVGESATRALRAKQLLDEAKESR